MKTKIDQCSILSMHFFLLMATDHPWYTLYTQRNVAALLYSMQYPENSVPNVLRYLWLIPIERV